MADINPIDSLYPQPQPPRRASPLGRGHGWPPGPGPGTAPASKHQQPKAEPCSRRKAQGRYPRVFTFVHLPGTIRRDPLVVTDGAQHRGRS
jgi:hypothetical protein